MNFMSLWRGAASTLLILHSFPRTRSTTQQPRTGPSTEGDIPYSRCPNNGVMFSVFFAVGSHGRPTGRRVASRPSFFADMVTIPAHRRSPSSRHRAIIDPAGSFCKANAVIPDKVWLDGWLRLSNL